MTRVTPLPFSKQSPTLWYTSSASLPMMEHTDYWCSGLRKAVLTQVSYPTTRFCYYAFMLAAAVLFAALEVCYPLVMLPQTLAIACPPGNTPRKLGHWRALS